MKTTTFSSREFNQHTARAKKAAKEGPVFVTDRGKPTHVLLSIEDYRKLTDREPRLADCFGRVEGVADIEVEFPRSRELARGAEFD